ncbi:hypothetical protein Y032_0473g2115 [Ancylostoma ceylanicum]|uniref:Uncharacterized protein n=1 Tax=Ancylostoma ceylanicum TaxID=53326 RepID=A0A016WWQ9_9BILA|nr:hypothetical protein Y032_0473g2115 [Ancylostoma ceylanicum]
MVSQKKNAHVDEVESVQRLYTYRCFARRGMLRTPYSSRLKKLGALSRKDRRLIADLTLMYKLTTDELDLSIWNLFEPSAFANKTRGHPFKVYLDRGIVSRQRFSSTLSRVFDPGT